MKAEIYRTEQSRDILLEFHDGMTRRWSFPHETAKLPTRHGETHAVTAGDREKPALALLAPSGLASARAATVFKRCIRCRSSKAPGR